MRAWCALGALPVGPELQLHYLIRWIKDGGVSDIDVLLSDLRCARDLYWICDELGANLHLCADASSMASHMRWILEHPDERFLVVPEDFHPAPGSILCVNQHRVGQEQLRPAQPFTLYQPRILSRPALARLTAERLTPSRLEQALLTGQHGADAESVPWSDAHLLRQPAAYLEVCSRAQRQHRQAPHPSIRGVRQATIEGAVQVARSAMIGRGAVLRDSVVLPGTIIAEGERLDRAIAFGATRLQVDGAQPAAVPLERLRVRGSGRRTPAIQRAVAAALLLAAAPVLALCSLAIKMESPGPVLYRQLRLGQNRRFLRRRNWRGHVVSLYKLRTMRSDADALRPALAADNAYGSGPFFKIVGDPRITAVGGVLRRLAIDELPQLINVVTGELALVGNRPLPVYEGEQLRRPWQSLRYDAPAGMTGLWQVLGRKNPDWRQRQFLDSYYAIHRNARLDAGILLRTLPAILTSNGDT
jgi:lipopolysaccharide/colanic/teichoic acid biosynthesis glycosyltransferase